MPAIRSGLVAVTITALLASACSSDDEPGTTVPTTGTAPPAMQCDRYDVDGCEMIGIVLSEPVDLATARERMSDLGLPFAIWRTDAVCVPVFDGGMPGDAHEASPFAYIDADDIRVRRLAAINDGKAPPITGIHISEDFWEHAEAQWARAQETGVEVQAMAVYAPAGVEVAGLAWVADHAVVPSVRTDTTDPTYPGELMLVDELFPLQLPALDLPVCAPGDDA